MWRTGGFAVALRSAHPHEGIATLYAGCGIMAGSDSDAEIGEIRFKFRPMLNAFAVPAYGPTEVGPLDREARTRGT
jgi:isochorismate synthase EntC